jgi:DNA-binding PadR family transcriptional regulator
VSRTPQSEYRLTDKQVEEVKRRQQALRDGTSRFATDEEMGALWKSADCGVRRVG